MTTPTAGSTPAHHSAFGDTFAVVRCALRLLWRHWPVLIALALAGFAARQGLLMASVKASALSPVVAVLVFALIPVSMLVAMLLMMRVVRTSLPESTPIKLADDRSAFLTRIASVLVPFLAVYAAYDYFVDDKQSFLYEVWFDETLNNPDLFNNPAAVNVRERLPIDFNLTMAIVIGSAIGLRLLFGLASRRAQGNLFLGFSRGYLEATWISLTALSFERIFVPVEGWVLDRRLAVWVVQSIDFMTSLFGPLSPAADRVVEWFGEILGSADAVLIVPFAWLTIGCVIYGHELVSPPRSGSEMATHQRWQRLPSPVRAVLLPLRNGADDRFGPMARGFRLLRHAGLRTMLLFCLAFVVAQSLPEWLWELERLIIGPQDLGSVWIPLSGPMSTLNESIGLMLTICLVTAAVDYVLRVPPPAPPSSPEPQSPPDVQPDVAGELGYPSYLYGDGLGVGGRDEQNRGSVLA